MTTKVLTMIRIRLWWQQKFSLWYALAITHYQMCCNWLHHNTCYHNEKWANHVNHWLWPWSVIGVNALRSWQHRSCHQGRVDVVTLTTVVKPVYSVTAVCMTTRAVNLQVLEKENTAGIEEGVTRLSCETGVPKIIYCDQDPPILSALKFIELEFRDLQTEWHWVLWVDSICMGP